MGFDQSSRRQFLQTAGTVALATVVAGCHSNLDRSRDENGSERSPTETQTAKSATATDTETPVPEIVAEYRHRFETVVDVVAAGADDRGTEAINDVLTEHVADDTLLYFPPGRFALDRFRVEDTRNIGFVADRETTIVPAAPKETIGNHFIDLRGVSDVLLDGLTFDFTERGYGGAVRVIARGDVYARNLQTRGPLPDRNKADKHVAYRFDVRDADSQGVVERVVARDGGHDGGNGVGIFVGKDHAGTLTFRDCELANFPNNGLYASAPGQTLDGYTGANGVVHVEGGRYENNNIANVRIGSTGSTVKGVTVRVDTVPPSPSQRDLNVRGIRLRERNDQLVENCTIEIGADAGDGFGAISYHPMHGSSTVRNTEIRVDRDQFNAIKATDASRGGTKAPLQFEQVTITGSARGGTAVSLADRPKTSVRNCQIDQTGRNRNGIVFTNSANCLVANSTIRVTGQPLVITNSNIERQSVTIEDHDQEQAESYGTV